MAGVTEGGSTPQIRIFTIQNLDFFEKMGAGVGIVGIGNIGQYVTYIYA